MRFFKNTTFYFLSAGMLLAACSTTKHLPPNEKLYTGAKVKLNATGLSAREKKVFRTDLQALTRPKPNSRLLGIPFKLHLYNMFRKKKANSFFGKFRDKNGEPPVLLSSVDLTNNTKLLRNNLDNKGFFRAVVTGDTVTKGRKGRAEYLAEAGAQYKINSVAFDSSSSQLAVALNQSAPNSLLKKGEAYNLDVIKGERLRIDAYLKERGFYYFSPEHLIVKVDSTVGTSLVDMVVSIKPETPANAQLAYLIDDVYIYTNYNLNAASQDTAKNTGILYEGYNIIDRRKRFKPKFFPPIMVFDSGELYNRTDHNLTLSRLINLNEFKFVKNRFQQDPDSAKLDAYYYLTPLPRQSLRAEINATTKSNNLNGTQLQVNWKKRNFFRAGEQLNVTAYIGSEIQFGGNKIKDDQGNVKRYNTYRTGAEANFVIPRFVTFGLLNLNKRSPYIPRTNIQLGYDILNRKKLYTINSFRGGIGYLWKNNAKTSHEFYPVSINYVQPINVTDEYRKNILEFPYLQRIIDSQFVLGSTYQFNYNELATGVQKTNSFYFNGLVDISGNVAGLLKPRQAATGTKRLFNAAFDQYIKLEADARYYRRFGLKSTWANRLIIGYGNPYGNSEQLPYIKQFFVGGNNSIRAFRSRAVGPGTYKQTNDSTFLADQTGDMKLELNTEFRPHISGPLYGAVFIDAGNIWLKNEDPTRPGSGFGKDFLNQLAIGGGVGIRLDIVMFVIRLDVGIPLRKPWEQNPFVMNQIRLNNPAWRKENIVYNLAIGYPF
ncbi:MAG TPA: BamA/TamA family outer membrane protein [Flavisolibacter sp.]|nr:BamA/TamA family outer membrane protein [Flavisolibacter sp.]